MADLNGKGQSQKAYWSSQKLMEKPIQLTISVTSSEVTQVRLKELHVCFCMSKCVTLKWAEEVENKTCVPKKTLILSLKKFRLSFFL